MEDQNNLIINKDNNQDEEIKIIEIVENNIVIDEKVPENNLEKNNDININKKENELNDKNNEEDNKEENIIVIKEVIDINKPNENNNLEIKEIKNDNIDKKENKEEKGLEEKLNMLLKEIKKKDSLMKLFKKDLDELKKENKSIKENFNIQIKELKEAQEKEINEIKQSYENKINEMKKDFAMKEDIKYFAKRREIDYVKDDLEALNSKFTNLEREYNSKMGFMESNMERIFKIEEENKKLGENNIVINQKEINDNKNKINNNANNNNKINHIDNNMINYNYFDEKKNEIIKKDINAQFDAKTYKDLKNILDDIFSDKNLKNKEISKKTLENLKKITEKYFINKYSPLEYFNEYVNIIAREKQNKISKEKFDNLIEKKFFVFDFINKINEKLLSTLKKEPKKVDIKDFNIKEFRNDFQLSEETYPDEFLKKAYLECKGNLNVLVNKLILDK